MGLYCYSAEALNPTMVRAYEKHNGMLHGFIAARSQLEAINEAMNQVHAYIMQCEDYDSVEMTVRRNEKIGTITVFETMNGKVLNHIQQFAVHEC